MERLVSHFTQKKKIKIFNLNWFYGLIVLYLKDIVYIYI